MRGAPCELNVNLVRLEQNAGEGELAALGFTQHSYHQGPSEEQPSQSKREPNVHVEFVAAVGVDVLPNERGEHPKIESCQAV